MVLSHFVSSMHGFLNAKSSKRGSYFFARFFFAKNGLGKIQYERWNYVSESARTYGAYRTCTFFRIHLMNKIPVGAQTYMELSDHTKWVITQQQDE